MKSARLLLIPLSWIYGGAVVLRNWLFDIGVLQTREVNVPVVAVGNVASGGVGKTPFVAMTALLLRTAGLKVAVISRGYGRRSRGYQVVSNGMQRCAEAWTAGDEPAELADALDGVVVAVGEKRVPAAQNVIRSFNPDVIVLDDAFQHRAIGRNLNVALVTAADALNGNWLIPAGNRREPLSSLRRADLVVVTRCTDARVYAAAKHRLERFGRPVAGVMTVASTLVRSSTGEAVSPGTMSGQRAVAFSGIGDPAAFEWTMNELGVEIAEHVQFRDHHWFTGGDIETIKEAFRRAAANIVLTTAKDVVRLREKFSDSFLGRYPVYTVRIEQRFIAGHEIYEEMLRSAVRR